MALRPREYPGTRDVFFVEGDAYDEGSGKSSVTGGRLSKVMKQET